MSMSDKKPSAGIPWMSALRSTTVAAAIILLMAQAGRGDMMAIYEGLTVWAIPAMFMLWGMRDLEGGQPGVGFAVKNRLLPAVGTLLIWGILFALLEAGLNGDPFTVKSVLGMIQGVFLGHCAEHLWVLYPLIGLYLVYPILQRFTAGATRGEAFYMLLLCFLFSSLIPMLEELLPRSEIFAVLSDLHVDLVLGWTGCYLAGWYILHFPIRNLSEDIIYILGIAGQIMTLAGDHVFGGGYSLWYKYSSPNVVFTALAVCTLFRYVLDERAARGSHPVGGFAMGIYFFHQVLAMVFTNYGLAFDFMPDALAVPLMALILFLLSIPVALILHKIPKLNSVMT